MTDVALSIMGVGFAAISVWSHVKSRGVIGEGWAMLAFLCFFALVFI